MAVKRITNPVARVRKRATFLAQVRRTTNQVMRGKIALEDVLADLRPFVEEAVRKRGATPNVS